MYPVLNTQLNIQLILNNIILFEYSIEYSKPNTYNINHTIPARRKKRKEQKMSMDS